MSDTAFTRTAKARPHPTPDVVGGRYRLDALLGQGGMASVHLGTDLVLERQVAVKVFHLTDDVADASAYEFEGRILAALNHPGLVTVFDAGIDAHDGRPAPFLIMEYVPGRTLAQVVQQGPLHEHETARLGCEVASALAYVHRHGVVHRDVKPANILVPDLHAGESTGQSNARLADFGIAQLVDGARLCTAIRAVGTTSYVSPEQARGDEIGPPSDVYSLALVLLECVTGEVVFPDDGADATAARVQGAPHVPDRLTPKWDRILREMLHGDAQRRLTAAEVAVALSGLCTTAPAPAPSFADTRPTTRLRHSTAAHSTTEARGDDLVGADTGRRATKVLDISSVHEQNQPATPRPKRATWPVVIALGVVVLGLLLLGLMSGAPRPSQVQPPQYPSVPGTVGVQLQTLERLVQQ